MKTCISCKNCKPITEYYKYIKNGKERIRGKCKTCMLERIKLTYSGSKEYRKKQRQKHKKQRQQYVANNRLKNRAKCLIWRCKTKCNKEKIPFDLDQHIEKIQRRIDNGICELTGVNLELNVVNNRSALTPSIDRICPSKGYVYSNIRIVCWCVNSAMNIWGEDVTFEIMKNWVEKDG